MSLAPDQQTVRLGSVLDLERQPSRLRRRILRKLPPGCQCLELDLAQTTQWDSRRLALLLWFHHQARAQNRNLRIRLVGLQPPVRQLLELARLTEFFEMAEPLPNQDAQPPGPGGWG